MINIEEIIRVLNVLTSKSYLTIQASKMGYKFPNFEILCLSIPYTNSHIPNYMCEQLAQAVTISSQEPNHHHVPHDILNVAVSFLARTALSFRRMLMPR
jgi:hypothetical protein